METQDCKVGDRVKIDDGAYPGIWVIKSKGPVNATLRPEDGGRGLRVPYYMLIDPSAAPKPTVYYSPGELVRVSGGDRRDGLWVVLADKGNSVNVAKLGGDGGRYLRAPRGGLSKVDPAQVLK